MSRKKPEPPAPTYFGPPRYCLYRRVSHPSQVARNLSLPQQRVEQVEHVDRAGGIVAAEFEDRGITAANVKDRPDFMAMHSAIVAGHFDVVLIHASDRTFRNHEEATIFKGLWRRAGVKLESVTESWLGEDGESSSLIEIITDWMSEQKLVKLRDEAHKGLRAIVSRGRMNGRPPFGYDWRDPDKPGSGWVVDEALAVWVRWIYAEVIGGAALNAVCRGLQAAGVPNPSRLRLFVYGATEPSAGWNRQTVLSILRNRRYTGRVHYLGKWYAGAHDAIVDDTAFDIANAIYDARGYGASERSESIYTGGFVLCPACWERGEKVPMVRFKQLGKRLANGSRTATHYYLRCSSYHNWRQRRMAGADVGEPVCRMLINERDVDAAFRAAVADIIGVVDTSRLKPATPPTVAPDDTERRRKDIEAEIARLPAERDNYHRLAARPGTRMTDADLDRYLDELDTREKVLTAALAAVDAEDRRRPPAPAQAFTVLRMVDDTDAPATQRRDALKRWLYYIVPDMDKRGIKLFWRT